MAIIRLQSCSCDAGSDINMLWFMMSCRGETLFALQKSMRKWGFLYIFWNLPKLKWFTIQCNWISFEWCVFDSFCKLSYIRAYISFTLKKFSSFWFLLDFTWMLQASYWIQLKQYESWCDWKNGWIIFGDFHWNCCLVVVRFWKTMDNLKSPTEFSCIALLPQFSVRKFNIFMTLH